MLRNLRRLSHIRTVAVFNTLSVSAALLKFVVCTCQVSEEKVREGTAALAEAHRQAGQEQEHSSKVLQAQQAATHSAQQQLQAAQVLPDAISSMTLPRTAKLTMHAVFCHAKHPKILYPVAPRPPY